MNEKQETILFVPLVIERLSELRDEILERVGEMRDELRGVASVCGEINSAEGYWLSGIESMCSVDLGNPHDYSVDNSIQALQEFLDENPPADDEDLENE